MKTKQENPLFDIARNKHLEQRLSLDYDFLQLNEGNENTYILGFCAGVSHATSIFEKQIQGLRDKITELTGVGAAPTLERQD